MIGMEPYPHGFFSQKNEVIHLWTRPGAGRDNTSNPIPLCMKIFGRSGGTVIREVAFYGLERHAGKIPTPHEPQ